MKLLVAVVMSSFMALLPVCAQEVQPITLSAQEYQQLLTELASRDPIMRLLIQKQDAARAAADRAKHAAPPSSPDKE
jgi:hypothetical protein